MPISQQQAVALLDFLKRHPWESPQAGVFYVANSSLNNMGIGTWAMAEMPFYVRSEHLEGVKNVILHLIDKEKLNEFTHKPKGFIARILPKKGNSQEQKERT